MGHSGSIKASSELSLIAEQLSALAQDLRESRGISFGESPAQNEKRKRQSFLDIAKQTYSDRRKRDGILGDSQLLGEPAWDILLDLYIAQAQGHEVSVSSACIGSAAPPTTGLRWLGVLQEEGLVERIKDPNDQRRILVRLTPLGREKMDSYFAIVADTPAPKHRYSSLDISMPKQETEAVSDRFRVSRA